MTSTLWLVLISQVQTLDDGCVFSLASLPKDTFTVAERVFELYSTGEIKGLQNEAHLERSLI